IAHKRAQPGVRLNARIRWAEIGRVGVGRHVGRVCLAGRAVAHVGVGIVDIRRVVGGGGPVLGRVGAPVGRPGSPSVDDDRTGSSRRDHLRAGTAIQAHAPNAGLERIAKDPRVDFSWRWHAELFTGGYLDPNLLRRVVDFETNVDRRYASAGRE